MTYVIFVDAPAFQHQNKQHSLSIALALSISLLPFAYCCNFYIYVHIVVHTFTQKVILFTPSFVLNKQEHWLYFDLILKTPSFILFSFSALTHDFSYYFSKVRNVNAYIFYYPNMKYLYSHLSLRVKSTQAKKSKTV